MIQLATLTREGFANGDISTLMSPRTVISWAENWVIFNRFFHRITIEMTTIFSDKIISF